jgi:replicative DNA helicase Mcm
MKVRLDLDLTFNQFRELLTYLEKNTIDVISSGVNEINNDKVDLGVLHGKPENEISKLKIFMDVFNGLSGQDKNDVEEKNFIKELIETGRFSKDDIGNFLNKAMKNGQIYERRSGFYAKA